MRHLVFPWIPGDAYRAKAIDLEKMIPKVKEYQNLAIDGKSYSRPVFDDGMPGQTLPGEISTPLHFDSSGGQLVGLNVLNGNKVSSLEKTQTKDSLDTNAISRARLQFDKEQASGDDSLGLTPGAILNAAVKYNKFGIMPAMGNGPAGSLGRKAMLNKAAELTAEDNITPQQAAQNQFDNKGNVLARNKAVASFATGKDGQSLQATNTGLNHLATLEQLALAQKNGQIPLFNKIANRFAQETGGTAPTNLDMAPSICSGDPSFLNFFS